MAAINTVPVGLQSLLGAKAFGVNPNAMTETAIPTINQTPFLAADLITRMSGDASGDIACNNDTVNASIAVPAGEAWLVISAEARLLFTAGSNAQCQLHLVSPGSATTVALTDISFENSIASTGILYVNSHVWTPSYDFIAGPGMQFDVRGQNASGGSGFYSVVVVYRRLVV